VLVLTLSPLHGLDLSYSQTSSTRDSNKLPITKSNSYNISNVMVPLNSDKLQIILKNETSNDSGSAFTLLTTLIATGGAIGGGIIGSYLTAKGARDLEEQKNVQAKELQKENERRKKKEEEESNAKIREIVLTELEAYRTAFDSFLGNLVDPKSHNANIGAMKSLVKNQRVYLELAVDARTKIFTYNSIAKIERAYAFSALFSETYDIEYDRYRQRPERLKETVESAKNFVVDAIESLKKDTGDLRNSSF
jgi:hypothetical protein